MSGDGRVRVLGLPVDSLDLPGLLDAVEGFIDRGAPVTVSYLNVHVANIAADDPELTRFLQTIELCYCDGSGVVLGARLLGESLPARMTGADWIWSLAARAEGRWRVAWIGVPMPTSTICGAYAFTASMSDWVSASGVKPCQP